MQGETKDQVLKRLNYIDGHLQGIRRMVDQDQYCVDVLKQTYAVRRAIEKVEGLLLDGHLHNCVIDVIQEGRSEQVVTELMELYELNQR
ncbi:MAG TPA: metal-sensitive transcriptional regulator [Dehalococcoidia bacterium]|nr:metal-sensitive transcriptional regulator [Dehalococcoidia bacterium]